MPKCEKNGQPTDAAPNNCEPFELPVADVGQAEGAQKLTPVPSTVARRRVDLKTVALAALPQFTPVESLTVRELKGIGATFTPNMAAALTFKGLVYKPEGVFDTSFQIIAGPLLSDPRITPRLKYLTFVPAFVWSTQEVVLAPYKKSHHGTHLLNAFESLKPKFPTLKIFVEWSDVKKRHVVHETTLSEQERELIGRVSWPTRDAICEALELTAFDDLDQLAEANTEIRTLLSSREVG